MIGRMVMEIMNTIMILMDAVIPNSTNLSEFVVTKVRKPKDVVRFVKKVAVPIFLITRESALALFPWSLTS